MNNRLFFVRFRIINSVKTTEGGGFIVDRPFPTDDLLDFDPFLLLDEMGPKNWKPGEAIGAPNHPHRGKSMIDKIYQFA
jgi:quercetin 2,3-dioxygenase